MKKTVKVRHSAEGTKGFFDRARDRARKLDRGEILAPEITVWFDDAGDLMRVLSEERVRLLRYARKQPAAVSDLAAGLRRDKRAVSRDVDVLEQFGLLTTRYESNPGHGKRRIVEPRAERFQLLAAI
jgi:predicted transcriptional regulator